MNIFDIKKKLFENNTIKQTVLKNTFWLATAELVSGLLRFIFLVFAARMLGVNEYGKFTFAFSFVSIMVVFSDLGMADITTREFSRSKEREKEFPAVIMLEMILGLFAMFLMTAGSFLITYDQTVRKTIWGLSFFIVISSFFGIFYAFFRSRQKMEYEAAGKIFQAAVMTALAFFVIFFMPSAVNLSYGYAFSNLVVLAAILIFFKIRFQPIKIKWDKSVLRLLKASWPVSLGFMNSWVYMTISSIMLGYFGLITENGWYNAASKFALVIVMPSALIASSFYPLLSNFFITSREKLQKSFDYLTKSMIFFAVPIIIGCTVLSDKIIYFLYSEAFSPSIFALRIFMIIVAVIFINYPYSMLLIVSDRQKENFILILIGIVVNIILNVILIPFFGLYGAIWSAITASLIVCFLTIIMSKKLGILLFDKELIKYTVLVMVSGAVMYFVITLPIVYNLNIVFVCIIGAVVYFSLSFLFYKYILKK